MSMLFSHAKLRVTALKRCFTTVVPEVDPLRRSYLYVPSSSDKMLQKSLDTTSDVVIYDLEDSVAPKDKIAARDKLSNFLTNTSSSTSGKARGIAVRLNDVTTPFFKDDIARAYSIPSIQTLILPKIQSARDLDYVSTLLLDQSSHGSQDRPPLRIVASIESAKSLWNLRDIASWKSERGSQCGTLSALLFAAEDFCADTSITRTPGRSELLYTRSQIALSARACGLEAIDMVCVNYKDSEYLKGECEEGRRLGFTGKQAIHPNQVEAIHSAFGPSPKEIARAAKIVHLMELAHNTQRGAVGLELEGGGKEMIDAPLLKQALKTLGAAKAANLHIPEA